MTVYIVLRSYDYEGSSVCCVFSTSKDAEKYAARMNKDLGYTTGGPYDVDSWSVFKAGQAPSPAQKESK